MLKEVVSLEVILGFIWNILYVDHPDTKSYTIAFVGSLLATSPFILGWLYWSKLKEGAAPREILSLRYWRERRGQARVRGVRGEEQVSLGLVSGTSGSVSDVEDGTESRAATDVEKGLGGSSAANVES